MVEERSNILKTEEFNVRSLIKCNYCTVLYNVDWIGLSSVLRPLQHSIGYMEDGFYRSEDPTNSIKVLKVNIVHKKSNTQ